MFLSLAAAGWGGYAHHVGRAIRLIALLRDELSARSWTITNDPGLAVLCVTPPPGSAAIPTIVQRVVGSGAAWISVAAHERREVIRACVTHGETCERDVLDLVAALTKAADT